MTYAPPLAAAAQDETRELRPKFDEHGLIAAIAQDADTGDILMMAWMNKEAVKRTVEEGKTVFWSRSRQKYWVKGETSGHVQVVKDVAFDCDGDTILIQVEQTGAACHEGYNSCFFRRIDPATQSYAIEGERVFDPKTVYGQ